MTQSTPAGCTLSAEHWQVLSIVADEAGCTPEAYIGEGIALALGVATRIKANREAGMDVTMIGLANEEEIVEGEDLEEWLRDKRDTEPEPIDILASDDELFQALVADYSPIPEVADPFADDEIRQISFDPKVDAEIVRAATDLEVDPVAFLQLAIDLRYFLQNARVRNLIAIVETPEEDAYQELTLRAA